MAGLLDNSLVEYNGFRFPPAINMRLSSAPVLSGSNQFTKYTEWSLEIECIIHPGVDHQDWGGQNLFGTPATALGDPGMFDWRRRLNKPNGLLRLEGKGFSDLNLNTGAIRDVAFGPQPQFIHLQPLASNKAYHVVWGCVFRLAEECQLTPPRGVLDWVESFDWSIAENGSQVRTINGQYEIANRLLYSVDPVTGRNTSNNRAVDYADRYRKQILDSYPPLPGFKRTLNFSQSPDLRQLNYNITDSEIQSRFPYPDYIENVDATHSVRSAGKAGFLGGIQWECSLTATYTLFPGASKLWAWQAFAILARDRRNAFRNGRILPAQANGQPTAGPPNLGHIITRDFDIQDSIYGHTVTFSLAWDLATERAYLFNATNLFADPNGEKGDEFTWQRWLSKLTSKNYLNPYGNKHLDYSRFFVNRKLGALCEQTSFISPGDQPQEQDIISPSRAILDDPEAEGQYLRYSVEMETDRDSNTIPNYPLEDDPKPYTTEEVNPNSDGTSFRTPRTYIQPIVQQRTTGQFRIRLTGTAVRYGVPVPVPEPVLYQGKPLQEIGTTIFQQKAFRRSLQRKPFYAARWSRDYIVTQALYNQVLLLNGNLTDIILI